MDFVVNFLEGINYIVKNLDIIKIKKFIYEIKKIKKKKGRIFFLGMGGSAGNCSHAVNDFRKLCEIECYTPTDNVSEFSARVNDEGLENTFKDWLKISHINKKDMIIIFSVGGGDKKRKISVNLINAIEFSKKKGAKILSILGKKGGYAEKNSDLSLIIPNNKKKFSTPYSESLQVVIWHLLISHPILQSKKTIW